MKSFDEFLAKRGYIRGYNHDYQIAYDFGSQSRQAEIDCLKVQLDGANERAMILLNHKNTMVDKKDREIALLQEQVDELHLKLKSNEHSSGEFISAISLACGEYLKESDELKKRIDELRIRLKAINEYQDIIFKELQFVNPNFELVFNKLEDIDDLSKGGQS